MKKTGLLLLLCLAVAAAAQQADPLRRSGRSSGHGITTGTFPDERVQTPTTADFYCGGFVSKDLRPNSISGGRTGKSQHHQVCQKRPVFLAGLDTRPDSNTRSCAS